MGCDVKIEGIACFSYDLLQGCWGQGQVLGQRTSTISQALCILAPSEADSGALLTFLITK